jgi:hypothetical protein
MEPTAAPERVQQRDRVHPNPAPILSDNRQPIFFLSLEAEISATVSLRNNHHPVDLIHVWRHEWPHTRQRAFGSGQENSVDCSTAGYFGEFLRASPSSFWFGEGSFSDCAFGAGHLNRPSPTNTQRLKRIYQFFLLPRKLLRSTADPRRGCGIVGALRLVAGR